jgi:hypothetical protein
MLKSVKYGLAAGCLSLSLGAVAADFSFTGTFSNDEEVQLFQFSLSSDASVTLRTYSYGGGTMADGTVIPAGGFDPILTVFDSAGNEIADNDDGSCPPATVDPVTSSCYDTVLTTLLSAGSYTVAVSQYSNFANGPTLSDGFSGSGTVNFEDVNGDFRTGNWAFDVLNVDSAGQGQALNRTGTEAIPTLGLWAQALLAALVAFVGFRASRRSGSRA